MTLKIKEIPNLLDEVDNVGCQGNKQDFHNCVIKGNQIKEKVKISGHKNYKIDFLGSVGEFFGLIWILAF